MTNKNSQKMHRKLTWKVAKFKDRVNFILEQLQKTLEERLGGGDFP